MEAKNLKFAIIRRNKDYEVFIAAKEDGVLTVSVNTRNVNFVIDSISPESLTLLLRALRNGVVTVDYAKNVNS
jgi:hypothetical protein